MSQQELLDKAMVFEEEEPLSLDADNARLLGGLMKKGLVSEDGYREEFLNNLYMHVLSRAELALRAGNWVSGKFSVLRIDPELRCLYERCFQDDTVDWEKEGGHEPHPLAAEFQEILKIVKRKVDRVADDHVSVDVHQSEPHWNYYLRLRYNYPVSSSTLIENPFDHLITVDIGAPSESKEVAEKVLESKTYHSGDDVFFWEGGSMEELLGSSSTRLRKFLEFDLGAMVKLKKGAMAAFHIPSLKSYIGEEEMFEDPKLQALAEEVFSSMDALEARAEEVEQRRSNEVEGSGE